MRTYSRQERGLASALSTLLRLAALSAGATESSRSRITASAASVSSFSTRRATLAGVNRNERIIAGSCGRPRPRMAAAAVRRQIAPATPAARDLSRPAAVKVFWRPPPRTSPRRGEHHAGRVAGGRERAGRHRPSGGEGFHELGVAGSRKARIVLFGAKNEFGVLPDQLDEAWLDRGPRW